MFGREKLDFIANHKFGISGRTNEPFGISVAEMAKAGCIVFVPDGGGQVEIVDGLQLVYRDESDATAKINKVLSSPEIQTKLQKYLLIQSQKFSTDNFQREIKKIVREFLNPLN